MNLIELTFHSSARPAAGLLSERRARAADLISLFGEALLRAPAVLCVCMCVCEQSALPGPAFYPKTLLFLKKSNMPLSISIIQSWCAACWISAAALRHGAHVCHWFAFMATFSGILLRIGIFDKMSFLSRITLVQGYCCTVKMQMKKNYKKKCQ